MKKIILAFALLFGFSGVVHLSAQQADQKVTFYFYPSSNVYYNAASDEWVYYDEPTTKWITVKTLPSTVTIVKEPVDTIYYQGNDVWKDNAEHQRKYKGKKDETKKKD